MGTFPQYAYPDCLARYAKVGRYIGCKGATDEEVFESFLQKIEDLKMQLHLPKTIQEAIGDRGSEEEFLSSLDKLSKDAFDDQCTGANPRYPLIGEIKELYLRAYYGAEKVSR